MLIVSKDNATVELSRKEIELIRVALGERIDFLAGNLQKINQLDFITSKEIQAKMEALLALIYSEESK